MGFGMGYPPSSGNWFGEGQCTIPRKKIIDFRLKMVHSGAFVQAYIAAGNF